MSTVDEILEKAKARLLEIEAEAASLRLIIQAAGEKAPMELLPVLPLPCPFPHFPPTLPQPINPYTPWWEIQPPWGGQYSQPWWLTTTSGISDPWGQVYSAEQWIADGCPPLIYS